MMSRSAAILTIDVEAPIGGVPSMVDAVYRLMEEWGYKPVVYRAEIGLTLSRWARLKAVIRNISPREVDENGRRTVLTPPLGLPIWLFYLNPYFLLGPLMGQHSAVFVISGSAHVALPLALRGIPYVLWIATGYQAELESKVQVGDRWAQDILTSPLWHFLLAQERAALRGAGRILTLSDYAARWVRQAVPDAAERVQTMLYPIDTRHFCPDPAQRGSLPHGDYLLMAARYNDSRKNVGLLLRAFVEIRREYPSLRLVLVGDNPHGRAATLVQELGLGGSVVMLDSLPHYSEELLRLYQGAQLFVLPSTQEGLGIVLLEAMACGIPVVVTRCGGPEDLVIDGETGRLVSDLQDPGEMAAAIRSLLRDPDRLAQMRENCRSFAERTFALPVVSEHMRDAYAALQAGPPRRALLRELLAAGWALLILASYVQHQLALHAEALRAQFLDPLVGRFP